ncbi:MAG: glutathione peroxidase [Pseudomonadota bacterium]
MREVLMIGAALLATACADEDIKVTEAEAAPDSQAVLDNLEEQRKMLEARDPSATDGAHAFTFAGLVHEEIPMSAFAGKPVLVVNTASKCGFTPQYEALQTTYETYKDQGLIVLGVPSNDFGGQEPGSAEEIEEFCRLNFGVTFPMAAKSVVQGQNAHPFYAWAADTFGDQAVPKWNFHKILIGRDGAPKAAFSSSVTSTSKPIVAAIEDALAEQG